MTHSYEGVKLKVLTADGVPAAGATVTVAPFWHGKEVSHQSLVADEKGFVDLSPLRLDPESLIHTLVVQAPGQGLSWIVPSRRKPVQEIRMHRPTAARLTILGSDGQPVEGVRIVPDRLTIHFFFEERGHHWTVRLPESVAREMARETDTQGRVEIPGLPQGAELVVDADDKRFAHVRKWVTLPPPEITEPRTLRLAPAATIQGRVTRDGEPVEGVKVWASGGLVGIEDVAFTDAEGRYRIPRLVAGNYQVALWMREDEWTSRPVTNLVVQAGDDLTGIDFPLERGGVITGQVRYAWGIPAPNVSIGVLKPATPAQSTTTDAEGRYRLRVPTKAGQPIPLGAFGRLRREVSLVEEETRTVDWILPWGLSLSRLFRFWGRFDHLTPLRIARRLAPQRTIEGTVADEAGRPLAGAEVELLEAWLGKAYPRAKVVTGLDGRYRVERRWALPEVSVHARAEGYGEGQSGHRHLPWRGTLTLAPLRLPRADSFVGGRVEDENGYPVAGAEVRHGSMHDDPVFTDRDGRFRVEGIPKGDAYINVYHHRQDLNNRRSTYRNLEAGRDDHVLVLRSNAS